MEVDMVTLSKLTPVKWAEYIKEGQCFRYWKTGHAQNCHTSFPPQNQSNTPHPQNLRTIETSTPKFEPSKNPFTPAPHLALDEYVNMLKTSGKSKLDILKVLTTRYKGPSKEIAEISTPRALDL